MTKYFVDLYPIAEEIAFPVTGYSIKALAPLAGFHWHVDDAGGGNSIVYYQTATSRENTELDRSTAITWLRSYNEDDVRATMAVRQYLRSLTL
jgi:predicted RecB family nuclease